MHFKMRRSFACCAWNSACVSRSAATPMGYGMRTIFFCLFYVTEALGVNGARRPFLVFGSGARIEELEEEEEEEEEEASAMEDVRKRAILIETVNCEALDAFSIELERRLHSGLASYTVQYYLPMRQGRPETLPLLRPCRGFCDRTAAFLQTINSVDGFLQNVDLDAVVSLLVALVERMHKDVVALHDVAPVTRVILPLMAPPPPPAWVRDMLLRRRSNVVAAAGVDVAARASV